MGSTITTGKLMTASPTSQGIVYAMFESVYESNVFPQVPRWSCTGIGDLETTQRQIFLYAGSCEGGMLRGPRSCIKPEVYISNWLTELGVPVAMRTSQVKLKVGSGSARLIPAEHVATIAAALTEGGQPGRADLLVLNQELTLQFPEDAGIAATMVKHRMMAPWAIMTENTMADEYQSKAIQLGHAPPRSKKVTIPRIEVRKVGESRLIQRPDGSWGCRGWQYSILESHIQTMWQDEATEPGGYGQKIRALRKQLSEAPTLEPGTLVRIYPDRIPNNQDGKSWMAERVTSIRTNAGSPDDGLAFEVEVNAVNEYGLTSLSEPICDWLVKPATRPVSAHYQSAFAL